MRRALAFLAALLAPLPAFAHPGDAMAHGVLAGFLHPLGGLDHLAAMMAIGLWAGLLGGRARLALPAGFVGAMAAGGALGVVGLGLPRVEAGILASVLVLGALVTTVARLPGLVALPMVAAFGLLHGHAHGVEMSGGALGTALGVLAATVLLLGAGLLLAARAVEPRGRVALRFAGGATATVAAAALLIG